MSHTIPFLYVPEDLYLYLVPGSETHSLITQEALRRGYCAACFAYEQDCVSRSADAVHGCPPCPLSSDLCSPSSHLTNIKTKKILSETRKEKTSDQVKYKQVCY